MSIVKSGNAAPNTERKTELAAMTEAAKTTSVA